MVLHTTWMISLRNLNAEKCWKLALKAFSLAENVRKLCWHARADRHPCHPAAASAWRCVRGCWRRTVVSGCVWPAGTCSGQRPLARPSWAPTPMLMWTSCSWMWALHSLCSVLPKRSRPGTDIGMRFFMHFFSRAREIQCRIKIEGNAHYVFLQVQQNWLSVSKCRNYAQSTGECQSFLQGSVFQVILHFLTHAALIWSYFHFTSALWLIAVRHLHLAHCLSFCAVVCSPPAGTSSTCLQPQRVSSLNRTSSTQMVCRRFLPPIYLVIFSWYVPACIHRWSKKNQMLDNQHEE